MKINDWLKAAEKHLGSAGIATARLDSLVLLEDVTSVDRAKLLAEPEVELTGTQVGRLKKLLNRRAGQEPLAYVRGKTEFYGREFLITPAVLEPRPESETMIDMLLELENYAFKGHELRIADVGTGSGALGITAKLELPEAEVELLEIDDKALDVAKNNVVNLTIGINVIKSDLLAASSKDYDVLLCNLPYVPDDYHINEAAGHEPKLAIFGGPDGLDVYRRLFDQIKHIKKRPLYILCESLPPQHLQLSRIAKAHGYKQIKDQDFIQLFKLA